jgi:hypothetical protein
VARLLAEEVDRGGDEADQAQVQIEQMNELYLSKRHRVLIATGCCHFCGEEVDDTRLFCANATPGDRGCADDYEREQAAIGRNHGGGYG